MNSELALKKLDPRIIKAALEDAARIFAKFWPLQSFITNNPLSGYEHLNFDKALDVSKEKLGWMDRLKEEDFRRWYAEEAMTLPEIRAQFERCASPEWETRFQLAGREIRLRDILFADLMAGLGSSVTKPDVTLNDLPETAGGALDPAEGSEAAEQAVTVIEGVALLTGKPLAETLDEHAVKWLSAYLDKGQAAWPMPDRHLGLRVAWQKLVVFDHSFSRESREFLKRLLAALPRNSYEALGHLLETLEVPAEEIKSYMRWHLARLPGWVGYMRWHIEQVEQLHSIPDAHRGLLADYLVLRLCTELALCDGLARKHCHCNATLSQVRDCLKSQPTKADLKKGPDGTAEMRLRLTRIRYELSLSEEQMGALLQESGKALLEALKTLDHGLKSKIFREALEATYQNTLLAQITHQSAEQDPVTPESTPAMQAVFCIDNRSEQFRFHLETCGNIQTLGFAGFFGIPTRLRGYGAGFSRDLCPVLMSPRYAIQEVPTEDKTEEASQYLKSREKYTSCKALLLSLMKNTAAMFAYVEAFGLGHAVLMLINTFFPVNIQHQAFHDVRPELAPTIKTSRKDGLVEGITLEEQAYYAEAALTLMGLTSRFSPIVLFCGHGTQTKNNPYESSLDCGACGGNAGGSSARILAEILNNAAVRDSLAARNIFIPAETVFLAAEHNTVTDDITFLNLNQAKERLSVPIEPLLNAFRQASELNRNMRSAILPAVTENPIGFNATDWSQVRPEWGTAGNASMIIGPRALTERLDLKGRAFLHSYDYRSDIQGQSLEAIMTGPLVVAQWINAQYLFSTLDNERFGSGSKTVHNVVGRFGVMRGNASDLQTGLPWQTLMTNDFSPYHMPLRLTAIVSAPRKLVERLIRRHALLKNLFNNQWIYLIVMDPESREILTYCPDGTWKEWRGAGSVPDASKELETFAS